ncbi:MAG: hypothetical protein ACK4VK_05100 [Aquificaceae bacterium]
MFDKKDKVLVAVSGGKDSLALWDALNRLGYKVDGALVYKSLCYILYL